MRNLVLLRGREMTDGRVNAALSSVDRLDPQAGAILREVLEDLTASVTALEANRTDTHIARVLTRSVERLATIAADAAITGRAAQAVLERLTPILERQAMADATEADSERLRLAQAHEAKIRRMEIEAQRTAAELERFKTLTKLALAAIPTAAVLASGFVYWLTGGALGG